MGRLGGGAGVAGGAVGGAGGAVGADGEDEAHEEAAVAVHDLGVPAALLLHLASPLLLST